MKSGKLINNGLALGLSLVFIGILINEPFISFKGIGASIGLLVEFYYFLNSIKK